MDRVSYLNALVRFGEEFGRQGVGVEERRAYTRRLIEFGERLLAEEAQPDTAGQEAFLRDVAPHAQSILWRVAGATEQRRRRLPAALKNVLSGLDAHPDLLGPIGYARTELAHSALVAFFLDAQASGVVGEQCQRAFREVVVRRAAEDMRATLDGWSPQGATVRTEMDLGQRGRVDVVLDTTSTLTFIEVKVDAAEHAGQTERYAEAIRAALRPGQTSVLVFLSRDPAQTAATKLPHVNITFRDLLAVWLPIAAGGASSQHDYLRRYLKTIASHFYKLAEVGSYDDWRLAIQRRALTFIEKELDLS